MINLAQIIFSTKVDRIISRSHETLSTGQFVEASPRLDGGSFALGPEVHRHNPPGAKVLPAQVRAHNTGGFLLPNQEGQQVSVSEPECRGAKSSDAGWAAHWASEGNRSPAADRRISTFGQTSD
ncbi:predicted protein [Coccidioides posadasii str. Silveira]|uniref:Predicted protein n=1 Tax=Coccidioides posadasii (strain RMSCC 757 / Silveira) TaxID=443226 RepID=E9DCM3_COCPS|nr:predicted protein [Coccidioides posadasii str. Silveira]